MTNQVFPTLAGLGWATIRKPIWRTKVQSSVSGKEQRIEYMSFPLYEWTVNLGVLRTFAAGNELATLQGFFNQMLGQGDTFLFTDPDDNAITSQNIGTGDGTTLAFQLTRAYGGFTEPVQSPNTYTIYINDWQGLNPALPTSRTNLALQSQTADNASWTKTNTTVTANATNGPDGTATADSLLETTANSTHSISQSFTPSASTQYTFSYMFKPNGRTLVRWGVNSGATSIWAGGALPVADFDLGAVSVSNVAAGATAKITAMPNGFYLCSITATSSGSPAAASLAALLMSAANTTSYTGVATNGMYVWGAQFETGGATTRYIVTTTASVSVTDYTMGATGIVTFASAPSNTTPILWTGTYYYRVRFTQDLLTLTNDFSSIWKADKLSFQLVKQ